MKPIQNELFDFPEEETEKPDSCYVYHKTQKNAQFYGETLINGGGRLTICFDKITEQDVRQISQNIYNMLNK